MKNKSQKFTKLVVLLLVGVMSFRDTGVFVKAFKGNDGSFDTGDKVEIIKETEDNFLVKGKASNIEVPKESMIKEGRSAFTYEVKKNTDIKNQQDNTTFRKLRKGEVVDAVYLDDKSGVFKTEDGITGVVDVKDLREVKTDTITKATATTDKVLRNGNKSFTIKRGNPVKVKGFENNKYIVVDLDGNEYKANSDDITLGKLENKPTRGKSLATPAPKAGGNVDKLIASAHQELGKPYVSGDIGRRGYDCSGLTYSLFLKNFGIKLPRTSGGQATAGSHVNKSDLKPGDLVFFRTGGRSIGHVGLYIGNNNMIHASTGQRRMSIANINNSYFAPRYVTARRIID